MAKKIQIKKSILIIGIIGLLVVGGFVGKNFFQNTQKENQGFNSIDNVEKVYGNFYNMIVSPEGYMTGDSCYSWMQGYGNIDSASSWKCFLDEVDPTESSCDTSGCERFTFKCVCFEK